MTILIVDDEVDIRTTLGSQFRKLGYDVVTAENGEEGLQKVKEGNIDLVILDLVLPKMQGESVCKEIRKDERVCKIPIIILTVKKSDTDRVIGRVIGADSYITKPSSPEILINEVKRLISLRKP